MRAFFQDLKSIGLLVSSVKCLQKVSADSYLISFWTTQERTTFFDNSTNVSCPEVPTINVAIFDAPYDLPDDALRYRLGSFGTVVGIKRLHYSAYTHIETGVRSTRMYLDRPIPSFLRFGWRLVHIRYEGQPFTCRKCNQSGHLAKDCPDKVCFNCDGLDHEAPDCTEPVKCSICKELDHLANRCQFAWKFQPPQDRDAPVGNRPGVSFMDQPAVAVQDSQPLLPSPEPVPVSSPEHVQDPLLSPSSSHSTSSSSPSGSSSEPSSAALVIDASQGYSPNPLTTSDVEMGAGAISQPELFLDSQDLVTGPPQDVECDLELFSAKRTSSSPNRKCPHPKKKR